MKTIRWGIRGTGYIANQFAQGMQEVENSELVAVASRKLDTAKKFAAQYAIPEVFDDLGEMLEKTQIDILYLATPNNFHHAEILQVLEAGIPVLSEKPMVDNAEQLTEVKAKAEEKDLFLMEGMWSRFFPVMKKAAEWVAQGKIGEVVNVKADFSYQMDPEKDQPWKATLKNNAGALRDVGIYSIAFADLFFQAEPKKMMYSLLFNGEVDDRIHLFLEYGAGKAAFLSAAFTHHGSSTAEIVGTEGSIQVGPEFWRPSTAKLIRKLEVIEEFQQEYPATGFQFEIEEVANCLRKGLKQSKFYSWADTERIAEIIEKVRKDANIIYDSDQK